MMGPWLHSDLALAVGFFLMGETTLQIAKWLGRPECEVIDAVKFVHDHQVYVRWTRKVESARRRAVALEERATEPAPAKPTPRIAEPVEARARYRPRRFKPAFRLTPPAKDVTAVLMGDPDPGRSALPQTQKGT